MQALTVVSGRLARMSVEFKGTPEPQVTWFKDDRQMYHGAECSIFKDGGEHTLMLSQVFPEDAGVYSCVAKNDAGEATSSAALHVEGKI